MIKLRINIFEKIIKCNNGSSIKVSGAKAVENNFPSGHTYRSQY